MTSQGLALHNFCTNNRMTKLSALRSSKMAYECTLPAGKERWRPSCHQYLSIFWPGPILSCKLNLSKGTLAQVAKGNQLVVCYTQLSSRRKTICTYSERIADQLWGMWSIVIPSMSQCNGTGIKNVSTNQSTGTSPTLSCTEHRKSLHLETLGLWSTRANLVVYGNIIIVGDNCVSASWFGNPLSCSPQSKQFLADFPVPTSSVIVNLLIAK